MTGNKFSVMAKKIFFKNNGNSGNGFSGKLSSVIVILIILSVSLLL